MTGLTRRFLIAALLVASSAAAQPIVYLAGSDQHSYNNKPRISVVNGAIGLETAVTDPVVSGYADAESIVISPDGTKAYVALGPNADSDAPQHDYLLVYRTATNTLQSQIDLGAHALPGYIAVAADGTRVYVPLASGSVAVVDAVSNQIIAKIPVAGRPASVVISADGRTIFAASAGTDAVSVIDATTLQVERSFAAGAVGVVDLDLSPDGQSLYVAATDKTVRVIGTDGTPIRTVALPAPPWRVRRGSGSTAYLTLYARNSEESPGAGVGVIDASAGVTTDVITNAFGRGLALTPDGRSLMVASFGVLTTVDLQTRVVSTTPLSSIALDVAVAPSSLCAVVVTPRALHFGRAGGNAAVSVQASGCGWEASVPAPFTVSANSGTGSAAVVVTAPPVTTGTLSTLNIGGQFIPIDVSVPHMAIDAPGPDEEHSQTFTMSGWAFEDDPLGGNVDAVHVWAYPAGGGSPSFVGVAEIGLPRADIGRLYGKGWESGWRIPVRNLTPGTYDITAFAHHPALGFDNTAVVRVRVTPTTAPRTQIAIDSLVPGETVSQPFVVSGWATDPAAAAGTGVDAVHVWAYPATGGAPLLVGVAQYGIDRPDIAAQAGAVFRPSGFAVVSRTLPDGDYTLAALAHSTFSGAFTGVGLTQVHVRGTGQLLELEDTGPLQRNVNGLVNLHLWAADERAGTAPGVDLVHVWAFPGNGGAPFFVTSAVPSGPSPVAAALFGPQFASIGMSTWGSLPEGVYTLVFFARSTATGAFDIVRMRGYQVLKFPE